MNDHEIETQEMRCALSAIANEVQMFYSDSLASNVTQNDADSLTTLLKYKNALKLRKEQIEMLRHNLKSACTVAKTLSAAKARETAMLNNQLNSVRIQYWNLTKQEKEKTNTINALRAENQTLQDKLQCLNKFIRLGYQETKNIRNESIEDVSNLKQLQMIISHCDQYYSDRHKEFEKYAQLEQRNRLLINKLRILENQLDTTVEELRSIQVADTKMILKENKDTALKNRLRKNVGVVCSQYTISHHNNASNLKRTRIELNKQSIQSKINSKSNLDLTRHLNIVKKLLLNQDNLIIDLKCLWKEINSEISMN